MEMVTGSDVSGVAGNPTSNRHSITATTNSVTTTNSATSTAAPSSSDECSSLQSSLSDYNTYPIVQHHDRLYLRHPENLYPLPCDLAEVHRQILRTLMLVRVIGRPFCSPDLVNRPPRRVLEVACGAGTWSSLCHDFFARHSNDPNVSFTGIDIISLAPDLSKHGVDWEFKQHDLGKRVLPFPDDYFDFVFIKDAIMCTSNLTLEEPLRVLKAGGILEMWDSDWVFQSLSSDPSPAHQELSEEQRAAQVTATYLLTSETAPFSKAQNAHFQDYNSWIEAALTQCKLSAWPCKMIDQLFTDNFAAFDSVGSRRVAIPLGHTRWEKNSQDIEPPSSPSQPVLNQEQAAIRHTAMLTVTQMIQGLEPILMEASGKDMDEWDRWLASLMTDLRTDGPASGECLDVSARWGRKVISFNLSAK